MLSAPIWKNKMGFDQSEFKKAVSIWEGDSTAFSCLLSPQDCSKYTGAVPNVLLVCPCCSFVTTMCLSIWYWKTASVTCLSFGQSVRVVAAQDHGSSDNLAGCIPGAVCLVLLESVMESWLLKRQKNYKGNVSKPLQAHH